MKNALITGASGGLGNYICEEYMKRGYRVFGWSNEKNAIIDKLEAKYSDLFVFSIVDLGSYPAVEQAAKEISVKTEVLDIIVNAAAILPANSALELPEFDIDISIDVYNINALGPLRVVKALLPIIKKGEDKLIIQISSEAASMATHNNYIKRYDYCMSKASLNIQSVILQRYLKDDGIRIYLVHPGWMKTSMGGEDAPLEPSESAAHIVGLFDDGKRPDYIFMDYNGTPRPW